MFDYDTPKRVANSDDVSLFLFKSIKDYLINLDLISPVKYSLNYFLWLTELINY